MSNSIPSIELYAAPTAGSGHGDHTDAPRSFRPALVQLVLVRWREFIREPEALFWTFIFPLLLAGGLGIAFRNRPPETVRVGVLVAPRSGAHANASINVGATTVPPAALDLPAILKARPTLAVDVFTDDSAAVRALRTGAVALVVTQTQPGMAAYRFDPSRPDARTARTLVDETVQRAAGRRDPVTVQERTIRERGSRYIDFLIPGLLGMSLMGTGIWSVVFSIVTARTKKLLKRLVATPMSRADYLLSFIIARFVFLVAEVVFLLGFGTLVFGVPIRGSLGSLAIVCILGAFSFNALGLLLASRAKTVEAVSGLTNLVMMPMWIFSGVFFSSSNFPSAFQPFINALPLTATVDALRAIMLQGATLPAVAGQLGILLVWLVLSFTIALRIFRWR